jgi:hypothetical protein
MRTQGDATKEKTKENNEKKSNKDLMQEGFMVMK